MADWCTWEVHPFLKRKAEEWMGVVGAGERDWEEMWNEGELMDAQKLIN